ncbi:unnamed protein product, partial [Scytosiphon promiscuus]
MKNLITLLIVALVFVMSCGQDDISDAQNQPPGTFAVSLGDITSNNANLTWTASTDPDGDNVTYEVRLGSDLKGENITATTFDLEGLSAQTAYDGKVIANDGNGGQKEASFSFMTLSEGSQNEDPGAFTVTV